VITRNRLIALGVAVVAAFAMQTGAAVAAELPAWLPIAGTGPTVLPIHQSEIQEVAVEAEGGTFTLTFNGQTTGSLPFSATPEEVASSLNALSSIGGVGGSVTVHGGPGNANGKNTPYVVKFGGSFENLNQPALTGSSALTGTRTSFNITTRVEGGPGTSTLVAFIQNIGAANTSGSITLKGTLPEGVLLNGPATGAEGSGGIEAGWSCTNSPDAKSFTCTYTKSVVAGIAHSTPVHPLIAEPGASGTGNVHITVEGGGAVKPASFDMPLTISETPAGPGFQSFNAGAYNEEGIQDTRAGGHPFSASSGILVNVVRNATGKLAPAGDFRNIKVALPPGFLGNPTATPTCPGATSDKVKLFGLTNCPMESVAGVAQPATQFGTYGLFEFEPVINMESPFGFPAEFKFNVGEAVIHVTGKLRSDGDYGLDVESANTPQILPVFATFFTFWGTPADPVHNSLRCTAIGVCGFAGAPTKTAFLISPTNCAEEAGNPPITTLTTNTWEHPEIVGTGTVQLPPVTGCENLHFESDFTFEPSETKSDSPASFRTSLTVPSEGLTDPTKLATPEIKDTVVQLPKGVVLNASGADGLQSCSLEQIGYLGGNFPMPNPKRFSLDAQTCPEASKIGTAELTTPLLEEPLHGALYLAAQGNGNPFGSLFAVYLVIEDPRHGIFIKLPGKVEPNATDGQMSVSFEDLPQLPFTRLDLSLKGGNRSALASPTTCGNYTTTATNTPWSAPESGPPTESANSFEINQGPNGEPCAKTPQERPFDLGWNAGAEKTTAGESGPFDFQVTRPDGSQELETLQLQTPQGVSASLKGIPYCTEAEINQAKASTGKQEQEHPACPSASQVGTAVTGAGSGPSPFYTSGKLYLAGPYKGAPISVVAVTPAVAGPFDLGNVVVRSAVFIDRTTAQVTAKTDPIPQILDGVVLRIKDVRIHLDRKDWTINPTSCEPSSVKLIAHGNSGATTEKSARFQVGGCSDLNFKPKLTGKVTGPTKRGDLPAFTATLTYPEGPGYANIKDVQVTLPHSEFLEQAHINTVCTRVQAAANACPAGSIYGYAEATTPLIDGVLKGPVFLKSSVHKLPDLAIALKGPENQPVEVEFAGRIDSVHGQIRNTIEGLPDVPVSKFVLKMKGGKKGLLVNSRNLCQGTPGKMTVDMTAQNNETADSRPVLGNSCGGKKGKKKAKRHQGHKRLGRLLAGW
jgi:hypothetical protein